VNAVWPAHTSPWHGEKAAARHPQSDTAQVAGLGRIYFCTRIRASQPYAAHAGSSSFFCHKLICSSRLGHGQPTFGIWRRLMLVRGPTLPTLTQLDIRFLFAYTLVG
jgi:hypothetical protein